MKKVFLTALIFTQFILSSAPDWDNQFDSSGYAYSMSMTVIVVDEAGNFVAEENEDMLAAFDSSGNIRGVGIEAFVPFNIGDYGDEKLFMIQVFSNNISGEEIRFKFYDTSEDHIYAISDETTVIFNDQTYPGSFTSPHHLIIQSGSCPSSNNPPEFEGWGYITYISGEHDLNEWEALYGDCPSYSLKGLYVDLGHRTSLDGIFSGLHTIEDNLHIKSWGSLTSINDFHNLTFIGGTLEMDDVNSLTSIQGLGERGISVNALDISNAASLSNCSDIPLFNCNMSLRSTLAQISGLDCDSIDVIGCDSECKPFNKSSGNSNTDLLLPDCAGNCGGSSNFSYCYEDYGDDWDDECSSFVCEDNALHCGGSWYGDDVSEHCDCNISLDSYYNQYENGYNAGVSSVDITSDNQAAFDAGVASVDGITQEDVDNAAAEAYILGAQSGDISGDGNLNITDIVIYIEKILED